MTAYTRSYTINFTKNSKFNENDLKNSKQ